jgi:hypothetical protein
VPTFYRTEQFDRDYETLSTDERALVKVALGKFIADVDGGKFRKSLRVRGIQGSPGVFEMTWDGQDGRATFSYGPPLREGARHVIWRRIGGHAIFAAP